MPYDCLIAEKRGPELNDFFFILLFLLKFLFYFVTLGYYASNQIYYSRAR